MSKRAQERRTGEELVVAKSRSVSLISRKIERESISHVGFGCNVQPGELQYGLEFTRTEKSGETEPKTHRQVLKCGTDMTILSEVRRDGDER